VPFVAHWPRRVKDGGAMRRQWIHVTDILPTVLEITGADYPQAFNGLRTRGPDGVSFAAALADAAAPTRRQRQYYELAAHRGFISGRWKIVSLAVPRQPIRVDDWMLFDLENDPAEIDDLAAKHPEVVARLAAEFEADATANYVYPLDNRDELRALTMPPHELARAVGPREFAPGTTWVPPAVVSPLIADRSFTLSAKFDWSAGDEGVIVAIGDRFCGMTLFVDAGRLYFVHQWWFGPIELAPIPLAPGPQHFELDVQALGGRRARGSLRLNGDLCHEAVELSPTIVRVPSGGLTVGLNRRQAVSERYADRGIFRYTGGIAHVRIVPGPQAPDSAVTLDEAVAQAQMRVPAAGVTAASSSRAA